MGLSLVGSWFNAVAVAVLLFHLTGRVSSVAFSLTLQMLPGMLLAPLGGAVADRFERKRLLVSLDAVRVFIALLPLLVHDASSAWLMYLSMLLLQVGANIYNPARSAYLPEIVPDGLLEPANATLTSLLNIAYFIGPAIAGLVIAQWGTSIAFMVNAASFAAAAVSLLTLPGGRSATRRELNPRTLFGGYVSVVRRYPTIARLSLCYLAGYLPITYFLGTMVAYTRALGQPTSFVGLFYAAAGLGGVVGSLLMGQYFRRLTFTQVVIIDLLSVPSLGLLVFSHNVLVFLLILAVSHAASNAGDVAYTTCVQRYISAAERGRVFGLFSWSASSGQVLGAGLGTVVAANMAIPAQLWVSLAALPIALVGVARFLLNPESVGLPASAVTPAPDVP